MPMNECQNKKDNFKIPFLSFVIMIFLTVYGIANPLQIYYQMGYASITYLVIAALVFFIPYCFMIAEMSSAFKHKSGGIYSWMSASVGEQFALIGTLMWYGGSVVMWFSASAICIQLSVALFGVDTTPSWHVFGLNSPETLAIIGAIYICIMGFLSTHGLKRLAALSKISIFTMIAVHILIIGGGLIVFALSGLHPAQSFDFHHVSSYFYGQNTSYHSILSAIGFMVFVIFIYGGMENSAGMVDRVENAHKNVPKAIILSCIIITALYIGVVLLSGFIVNWQTTFGGSHVNLANYQIFLVQQEFFRFGTLIGMTPTHAISLGHDVNRLIVILQLLGLSSIPLIIYSPIKHMFEGLPKGIMPDWILKKNKHDMASNAILLQTIFVVCVIFLLGFGATSVSSIFNKMTLMTFVAGSIPYSFIVFAYIKFKKNNKIKKEYQFFGRKTGIIYSTLTFIVITLTNIFSIIQPALQHDFNDTIWIAIGPILFAVIGFILHARYKRKITHKAALTH